MSVSQGGRSLRNRAPIDYTSCFYKNKLSRDEPRFQKSDEQPVLATRPRKKKQKLSQESETSPEEVAADEQIGNDASEPLLDRTNTNHPQVTGDTRKRSQAAKHRTSSKKSAASNSKSLSEDVRIYENAGQEQQHAYNSKQVLTDEGEPARKRGKSSKGKKAASKAETSCEQQNMSDGAPSRRSGESEQQQQQAQRQNSQPVQQQHDGDAATAAVQEGEQPEGEPEQPAREQVVVGSGSPQRASVLPAGNADQVVEFLFRADDTGPNRPAANQNVARVASMWDRTLKTRLDASQAYAATLQARNQAVEEELKRQEDEMAATVEQFSKEKARIVKNYQQLYAKFQEIRSRDRSEIEEVIESIWDAIQDHKNVADAVSAAWKEEAIAQQRIVEEYAASETLERIQSLEEENTKLKAEVLDEGHMLMLATQEINELKSLVAMMRAAKPPTHDFGCSAAPETCDVGCAAAPETTDVAVGLGKGTQWDSLMSPVAAARARRRTDLGVTRLACDMVPEGVDVNSLDTDALRLGLIKATDPSELASTAPMQDPMHVENGAPGALSPWTQPAVEHATAAVVQNGSPLQQQAFSQQISAADIDCQDVDMAPPPASTAAESQAAAAGPAAEPAEAAIEAPGVPAAIPGARQARLSSTAAHAAVAAAHAMHRVTPPQLGWPAAQAASPVNPGPFPQPGSNSIQASNGPSISPFDAAIAAATRVAAVADAAAAAPEQLQADVPIPALQAVVDIHRLRMVAEAPAARKRSSASTVEQGGQLSRPTNARGFAPLAVGTALNAGIGSPQHVTRLRNSTRQIQSDPFPAASKNANPKPKQFFHRALAPTQVDQQRAPSVAYIPQQLPGVAADGDAAGQQDPDVPPGRILSPVDEEQGIAAEAQPALPAAESHQLQYELQQFPAADPLNANDSNANELVVAEPPGCAIRETEIEADACLDGDGMSTSESDRAYGDDDTGAALMLDMYTDAQGGVAPKGAADKNEVVADAVLQAHAPEAAEIQACTAEASAPIDQKFEAQHAFGSQVEQEPGSGGQEASRWAYSESIGRADSAKTTNSLSKYRGFRDKMLGMELRLNRDGTEQWAKHLASGFTFTIRQCTPLNPRINGTSPYAAPDELTYVPHMERCPEHISAAIPGVWTKMLDFKSNDLHGFQQRLDRMLEQVLNPAA